MAQSILGHQVKAQVETNVAAGFIIQLIGHALLAGFNNGQAQTFLITAGCNNLSTQ